MPHNRLFVDNKAAPYGAARSVSMRFHLLSGLDVILPEDF
jgi:hypothetical protein